MEGGHACPTQQVIWPLWQAPQLFAPLSMGNVSVRLVSIPHSIFERKREGKGWMSLTCCTRTRGKECRGRRDGRIVTLRVYAGVFSIIIRAGAQCKEVLVTADNVGPRALARDGNREAIDV